MDNPPHQGNTLNGADNSNYSRSRYDTSLNPTCDDLIEQDLTDEEEHTLWNGHLSLIDNSETICKVLYKKFFLHSEVSVLLADWTAVLRDQLTHYPLIAKRRGSAKESDENGHSIDTTNGRRASTSSNTSQSDEESGRYSPSPSKQFPGSTNSFESLPKYTLDPKAMRTSSSETILERQHHHDLAASAVTCSRKGVVSALDVDFFDCVVVPYFSSYSVPPQESKELQSVFGKHIVDKVDAYIRDEYQGEQPPGSAFVIPTRTEPCKHIVCVSVARDVSYISQDYAYNAFRAALLAIHNFNKNHSLTPIKKILCPAFEAPQVCPFNVGVQMATCYLYWDWNHYPAGTQLPLTMEVINNIAAKIKTNAPTDAILAQDLENLVAGKMLEGRGIVYERELNILMTWIDGSVVSPFPRVELAKLLIAIARKPHAAPFTLNSQFIYTHMTPSVLAYIVDLCQKNCLQVCEDIPPEEIQLGEPFAGGISGRVHRGVWKGQQVAVKKFFVSDPPAIRNEIALMSLLKHPNLIECYGGYLGEESASFVSELLDCNLYDLLRKKFNTQLDFDVKIRLAINIAEGMAFLHARSIIHRDLKSVNVLIRHGTPSTPMKAKLCDFGLSRVKDQNGDMTGNIGTSAWIAPEVFQSKKYSEKCDVYSFGVILFELLTQTTPYREISAFRIPEMVIKGKRPSIPDDSNAPKAYLTLMQDCWKKNPDKRPSFATILTVLSQLAPQPLPPLSNPLKQGSSGGGGGSSNAIDDGGAAFGLNGNIQEKEEQLFKEMKKLWEERHGKYTNHPLINDALLYKCLRARRHVVKDAKQLLNNYVAWYKYMYKGKHLSIALVRSDLEKKICYYTGTNDVEGSPVILFKANQYYVNEYPIVNLTRTLVYCLERVTESEDVQRKGITLVACYSGYKMANFTIKSASAFFETLKGSFPVVVKQILYVDAPPWLPKFMVSTSPILGSLMSKIVWVTKDTLKNYISVENIVPELSGRSNFDLKHWIRSQYEKEQIEYQ